MNTTAIRNIAIVGAIAGLGLVWQSGFGESTYLISRAITIAFVVLIGYAVYRYFAANRLAWYAIPRTQRPVFIVCLAGTIGILLFGQFLLPYIGTAGVVFALVAMVLGMIWIVMESRRL